MDAKASKGEPSGGRRVSARLVSSVATDAGGKRARAAAAAAVAAARRARAVERAREVEDSPRDLRDKCRRLARAVRDAKHLVVYTGAGVSTAADIPDYRGPRGVWTRLRRGEAADACDPAGAAPTFAHMALTALWRRGLVKFVVSQNCDGLHVRAGLPRRALAELHGDMFAERCAACRRVYLRAFDTTRRTARHAHGTRRRCHACGTELLDTIVHFGERGAAAWPLNWAGALRHAAAADVVLCLGSSLKVLRRYPRLWSMQRAPAQRPRLYIVNLQWTPKDAGAALKINARCDAVLAQVTRRLRVRVPRYRAERDPLLAHAEPLLPAERHTAGRALRPPPSPPPSPPPAASACSTGSVSPISTDDEDDHVPLRRLAERLRAPPAPPPAPPPAAPVIPPPPPPPPPPPALLRRHNGLCAFQVSMVCGDATILLRSQHAPAPAHGGPRRAAPPPPRALATDRRRSLRGDAKQELGGDAKYEMNGEIKCDMNGVVKYEINGDVKCEMNGDVKCEMNGDAKCKINGAVKCEPYESDEEAAGSAAESDADEAALLAAAAAAAAASTRRARLLWRAWLWPGLATLAAGVCAWCWRERRAPRCLWYGPARHPPATARAGAGRCACCRPGRVPIAAAPTPHPGWFGKGCQKGRRRPRR